MRNIKMLGLLAVSAMALVAFVGTASASAESFTAGQAGKALSTKTLEQEVFTVTGSNVVCDVTKFEGETEGTEEEGVYHSLTQTVHPVYDECTGPGGFPATVTTTGCSYTFKAATDAAGMATVNLSGCTTVRKHEGGEFKGILIAVHVPFIAHCEIIVPNQSIASAVSYTNSATGGVKVKATAEEITAIVTEDKLGCPLTLGTHEGENGGTYFGESEVTAEGDIQHTKTP